MATAEKHIEHTHEGVTLEGVLVGEIEAGTERSAVLIFGGWEGRADGVVDVANLVAADGHLAFAADVYGEARTGADNDECEQLMAPFMADRRFLGDRLDSIVEAVAAIDGVDGDRMAAIGFCFGGLCVLDLARRDAGLAGVVSFHGVLSPPPFVPSTDMATRVLVLHGWDDPLARPDDVTALARELSARNADWQLHTFGSTKHAFMVPSADDPDAGVLFNPRSAGRAWAHSSRFLAECLGSS